MKHFNKLNIASAISLAVLAIPAQAVVKITGDELLTDKTYAEALEWTPTANEDALVMNNITIDTGTSGSTAMSANALNNNKISINDSTIASTRNGVHIGKSQDATINIRDSEINVGIGTLNQSFGVQLIGDNNTLNIERSKITTHGGNTGTYSIRLMDLNASTVNISDSEITAQTRVTLDDDTPGKFNTAIYFQATDDSLVNVSNSLLNGAIRFNESAHDNTVNMFDSKIIGEVVFIYIAQDPVKLSHNTVNFIGSTLEGRIGSSSDSDGGISQQGSAVNFTNGSMWTAKGISKVDNISVINSTVDITNATINANNWYSEHSNLLVSGDSRLNVGTGSGDMNVVIKSDGRGDDYDNREIISVANGGIAIQADRADLGAYKYQLVENNGRWILARVGDEPTGGGDGSTGGGDGSTDGGDGSTDGSDGSTGGNGGHGGNNGHNGHIVLSNSANAVLSSLAAPLASWNTQTNTLYDRLNSRMDSESSNVWATYYGSTWAGEAGLSSSFKQNINGLAVGVDKTLPVSNGQATFGAAVMHDNSHLSNFDSKGSGGSMESTSVQAYGRLAMDNGVFYKGTVSAGQARSKVQAHSSDGAVSRGNYTQDLLGLTGQAGYRYQVTQDVYVAPYAQMNGYTASGADFSLDNGLQVNSDRYWSARGELGMEAGVKTAIAGMAVTPHVMMATGHEFVKDNDVGINGDAFSNSVDGSGYKFGAGVEAQVMKDLSAGVNVNYSRNRDVEQRFGVTAGMRYSF